MIVCLDTNIVIYYIEQHPVWWPRVDARLRSIAAAGDVIAVCDAARLECLVGPFQAGDISTAADYRRFFQLPEIQMLPVSAAAWERAAEVRTINKPSALDSIHLAAAIEHGCGLFLTNDAQLSRCTLIPIEVLA